MARAESRAAMEVVRRDGAFGFLPDPDPFLYMYVRNEAGRSWRPSRAAALEPGVRRSVERPSSMRLLRELHATRLSGTRGAETP